MATSLTIGAKAPAFSTKDQNGNTVTLAQYKGKKLVLYFYPEDDTPVCTVQACNIRDNYAALTQAGITILGISPNDGSSHKKFEAKYNLPFPLLADADKKILNAYGVWGEKNMYGNKVIGVHRTTFLINEKGIIVKIILRPKNKEHAQEILKAWDTLTT